MTEIYKYGELLAPVQFPRKYIFYEGQQFGNWTVIDSQTYQKASVRNKVWVRCKCKCGLEKFVAAEHLTSERSKGCRRCKIMPIGIENKNWQGVGPISATFFCRLKYDANKRNIPFELDISYLAELFKKQDGRCALTGRALVFGTKGRSDYYASTNASLDRIDSSKNYTNENVQWVHKNVNMAKRDLSQQEFITLCNDVVKWKN